MNTIYALGSRIQICILVLSGLIFIQCDTIKRENKMNQFSTNTILSELDSCGIANPAQFFPNFNNIAYIAGNRVNLFANDSQWAIVYEISIYSPRSTFMGNELYYFGNCLRNLDYIDSNKTVCTNIKHISLVTHDQMLKLNANHHSEYLNPDMPSFKIRDSIVSVEHNKQEYIKANINLDNEALIHLSSVLRYIDQQYPNLLRCSDEELRTCIPNNIPKICYIDAWHHTNYNLWDENSIKPSSNKDIQNMAELLTNRKITTFKSQLRANNNWRNWNSGYY